LCEELLEMAGFFLSGAASCASDAVIAAADVVMLGIGTLFEFINEAGFEKAFDGAIERAGAELNFAGGALGDFLHDGIAVAIAIGQGDEDVEAIGGEGGAGHWWEYLPMVAIAECGIVDMWG
jgi:hypothetical protein